MAPGVWRAQSALYALNSVLVEAESGWAAVDPGLLPGEVAQLAQGARELAGSAPILTVLSHSDFDHLAGIGSLGQELAVSEYWDVSNEAQSREELTRFDREYYLQRPWGSQLPGLGAAARWRDGEVRDGLYGFWMPGHTWDGLALVVPARGLLAAGDYLSGDEIPLVTASWGAYRRTVDRFAALVDAFDLALCIPGHGEPARGRRALAERVAWARDYLDAVTAVAAAAVAAGRPWQALTQESASFRGRALPPALAAGHRENLRRAWEAARWGEPPGPLTRSVII